MRRIAAVLLVVLAVASFSPFFPRTTSAGARRDVGFERSMACDLKSLGLFMGVGVNEDGSTNFNLERVPTRAEALAMLVRILGKEDEATRGVWTHPFGDVPGWAEPYVGYAYANGLTHGISSTEFGTNDAATSCMYLTFVLRSLGYSDADDADFVWNEPFALAKNAGILPEGVDLNAFWRADVVLVSYAALFAGMKGGLRTLAEHLVNAGAFSQAQFDESMDERMLLAHTVPELRLKGNWPCSEGLLQAKWAELYPLYAKYLGLPTKILTEGITWEWDETITPHTVGYYADTNSFMMGPLPHHDNFRETNHYDYEPLILQCMHETAHLFWQIGASNLTFGFGQWAWEAAALVAEKLLVADHYGDMPGAIGYDLHSYSGWETINGVMADGNKYDRTLENSTASEAFFILATVLSAGSGNRYFQEVNDLRLKHYSQTGELDLSLEDYARILDEVAGGKTIDGMKPSQWFVSQPVANTDGAPGDYLIVYPSRPIDDMPGRYDVQFAGWNRYVDANGDKAETGFAGQNVTLTLYDALGGTVSSTEAALGDNGCGEASFTFPGGALPLDTVVRYTATATVNGRTLSATNLGVYARGAASADNDEMIIIFSDKEGNVVTDLRDSDVTVAGALSTDASHLRGGYIAVKASQGSTVTVSVGGNACSLSKPLGPRVVPIIVKR